MKNFKRLLQVFFTCAALISSAYAQKISGTVTDASGKPISGASVIVRSTKAGTSTDASGKFSVTAKATDMLQISATGYAMQEVAAGAGGLSISLQQQTSNLETVVLGSRGGIRRVRTESPVPVDVIAVGTTAQLSARPDLTSMLNYAAPSFNYNKQSGSDGADQIDLATLRGLGPDQTLVLINGKRQHQTAFVAVFGTRGRGNSGTDLNAIPETAIDRVEILRDGASAQYGSDAIAGVINLILKKDVKKLHINVGTSTYYDKKFNPAFSKDLQNQYEFSHKFDGWAFNADINEGFALGKSKKGYINLSANYFTQGKTYRQVLDTNLTHTNALPINAGRRANGDGSVTAGGGMYNLEVPIASSRTTFYSFGGLNYKSSDAFAYTRTFHGFNPLSSDHPERFPTDLNGNLIWMPSIMKSVPTPGDVPDTVYNPHIQTHISDYEMALGFRGKWNGNWEWDISNTLGKNDFHYFGDKTFNASLGAGGIMRNHFDDGGFGFFQNTSNVDLNKSIPSLAAGLNLAIGAEYRFEEYNIYSGEVGSYLNFDPSRTKAAGSQGFPGFQPSDAVKADRINLGGYTQADLDVTKDWLVSGAVRYEHYSDFGSLATYKLATRYKVSPKVNIRASASTGFRAPSLQQINFSNTFTNVQGGNSFDVKIAPNYSPITQAAGIPKLKQEKSVNAGLGFTARPTPDFTVTVDGYYVQIKDRVVLTGSFDNTNAALAPILNQLNVADAQFFANAVNTTNTGVDVILNYSHTCHPGRTFNALFAANLQHMKIDKVNVPAALNNSFDEQQHFFSQREERFVLSSAPPVKLGLTLDYPVCRSFKIGTHITYFGKISLLGYGYTSVPYPPMVTLDDGSKDVLEEFNYKGKAVADIYASYKFCKHATMYAGVDNIFNTHPTLGYVPGAKQSAYDGETGGPWDAVQMGTNGIRPFVKLGFDF